MVARGMEAYLCQNKILFKDYFDYVKRISREVKQASIQAFEKLGLPVPFLRNPSADKEAIAREIAQDKKVESGLVCALSTVEPGRTFEHLGTHMVRRMKPCQAIYHYPIDPQLGWMYARLQTWFPFHIQVGMNGREWLARQMDQAGLKIPPAEQLFCLDRRLPGGAEVTEPATGDRLGRTVERICRKPESAARNDIRKRCGGLLLDRFSDRVGQRHRVCPGRFSKPADAAVGAARDVELFQCRCDALLWPESESVGSHPGAL
jgi:hypothetical protein